MIYIVFDELSNAVKIGTAKNVEIRVGELQIGNPRRLQLLASFEGGRAGERFLHELLDKYRLGGEWFDVSRHGAQNIIAPILLKAHGFNARLSFWDIVYKILDKELGKRLERRPSQCESTAEG